MENKRDEIRRRAVFSLDYRYYALFLVLSMASPRLSVLADLVAYFPFDGESLREEVTGGLAVQGGASFVADGVGSHAIRVEQGMVPMTFADGGGLDILGDLTLSAWVKPDTVSDPFQPFMVKSQPGFSAYRFTLRHDGFGLDQGTGLAQAGTGSIGLVAEEWQHLAVTRTGDGLGVDSIVFYLNGVEVGRTESSQRPESVGFPLSIGERQGNEGEGLAGFLDELRIYNSVRSALEIAAEYEADQSRLGLGLAAYFPFDGESLREEVTGGLAVQGGASFVAEGVGGHAIRVERGMEPMTFADGGSLNILGDLSMSAWVKPDTVGDPFQPFLVKSQPGRSAYRLTLRHDGFGLDQGTSLAQAGTGSIGLVAGEWQHLAVTRAGDGQDFGSIVFYLDGVEIARSESSQAPEAVGFPLSIGERQGNVGAGLSGLLDELRIYKGVLTPEAVLTLAENGPVESPDLPPLPDLPVVGEVRLIHEGLGRFVLAWGGSSENGFLIQESSDLERWSVIGRVRGGRPRLYRIRPQYPRPRQSFYRVVPFADVSMGLEHP